VGKGIGGEGREKVRAKV
jgi:hypothetical protein